MGTRCGAWSQKPSAIIANSSKSSKVLSKAILCWPNVTLFSSFCRYPIIKWNPVSKDIPLIFVGLIDRSCSGGNVWKPGLQFSEVFFAWYVANLIFNIVNPTRLNKARLEPFEVQRYMPILLGALASLRTSYHSDCNITSVCFSSIG